MMRKIVACMMMAVLLLTAGTALAAVYEWTGGGADDLWDNEDNWQTSSACTPPNCFPRSANDDAIIAGEQTVDVTDETIDDLTIQHDDGGTTTLDDGATDAVLEVDSLLLENTASAHVTNTFVIEIRGGITITNDP